MNNEHILMSVIIPIYNTSAFLEKCLTSVIKYPKKDIEIILVNDGSTDNSLDICRKYSSIDTRIKLLNKENGGLVSARKYGLSNATGEYVFNIDSDDWIESDSIKTIINAITFQKPDVLLFNYYEGNESSKKEVKQDIIAGYHRSKELSIIKENMMYSITEKKLWTIRPNIWCKVFKRSLAEIHQIDVDNSISFGEDAACVYPLISNCNNLLMLDKCLYNYRSNPNSMVRAYDGDLYNKTIKLFVYLLNNKYLTDYHQQIYCYFAIMLEHLIVNELKKCISTINLKRMLEEWCADINIQNMLSNIDITCFRYKHAVVLWLLKNSLYLSASFVCNLFRFKIIK